MIVGIGKKGKQVGYIGVDKCPNCKNYVHFRLYEYSDTINAYFIPIAKFNKKTFLVCPVCETAWELSNDIKDKMLEKSINSLSPETTQVIWGKASKIVKEYVTEYIEMYGDDGYQRLIEKCAGEINKEIDDKTYIQEIVEKYLQFYLDDDRPK